MFENLKKLIHPGLRELSHRSFFKNAVSERPENFVITHRVAIGEKEIRIFGYGAVCRWRAATLLSKEPETIGWMDSFAAGETLWDIGANIGVYALYAGAIRGCRVVAFEPAAQNYYILNKNIELNGLAEKVRAFPVAFSYGFRASSFSMSSLEGGNALSTIEDGPEIAGNFTQGLMALSLDEFVERGGMTFPDHLKIDVDGEEHNILLGGKKLLADKRLRTLLIELDGDETNFAESLELIRAAGFEQVEEGVPEAGNQIRNFIFRRS
ncbi:MAG: FkbM family methyltransferase [Leptospirales bacterium]|jgi:FkbM family methyltransferase